MKTELTTVPTFIFYQGQLMADTDAEFPIQVTFWDEGDSVELKMLDDSGREITLSTKHMKRLFKEIERHLPEATKKLKSKQMYLDWSTITAIRKEFDAMTDLRELETWRNDMDKRWAIENNIVKADYRKAHNRLKTKWLTELKQKQTL